MIELTEEQASAVGPGVTRMRTPAGRILVVMPEEQYEQLPGVPLLSELMIHEIMAADDANDPLLEEYQQYRQDRS